ncbi:hypothetical protein CSOJ01_01944 [Colletotrichum sojae]|uniref:Uncharacterized protein n=1 Tax=Colletotrichum sojae TaxID=2175907 RepID=A0A8H6JTC4_9PEZI|nr:hypothetical protein CSOJ01_01944 [Colletotrichum sojae]
MFSNIARTSRRALRLAPSSARAFGATRPRGATPIDDDALVKEVAGGLKGKKPEDLVRHITKGLEATRRASKPAPPKTVKTVDDAAKRFVDDVKLVACLDDIVRPSEDRLGEHGRGSQRPGEFVVVEETEVKAAAAGEAPASPPAASSPPPEEVDLAKLNRDVHILRDRMDEIEDSMTLRESDREIVMCELRRIEAERERFKKALARLEGEVFQLKGRLTFHWPWKLEEMYRMSWTGTKIVCFLFAVAVLVKWAERQKLEPDGGALRLMRRPRS